MKKAKDLLMKVSCCALGAIMLGGSIISCFYGKSILALAEENTPMSVAYFEGLGANISENEIHNKTRKGTYSSDSPSITVFVHGQSGEASHWSNDGEGNLAYDEDSLIEKLRDDYGGANVYWARMARDENTYAYNIDEEKYKVVSGGKNGKDDIFEAYGFNFSHQDNRFFLTKLEDGEYKTDNSKPEEQTFVTKLSKADTDKHIILVYESAVPKGYHRDDYRGVT